MIAAPLLAGPRCRNWHITDSDMRDVVGVAFISKKILVRVDPRVYRTSSSEPQVFIM